MDCKLIAVLGAGGVGKTTSSASIGMALAQQGHRVAVITVDPAKRLAQALGLQSLTNEPQRVTEGTQGGSLDALWLDTAKAVEDVVRSHVSPSLQGALLNHRLFKIVQSQLGGIEEYLGVERLLRLGQSGNYDVCILDTPPSRHALDFLDSPKHLLKFFDESVLRVFMNLARAPDASELGFFKKLLRSGTDQVLDVFRNFLGRSFLSELAELLTQMKPIYAALKKSSVEIEAWVKDPSTRFVVVSLAEPYPMREAELIEHELRLRELNQARLLVLNRSLPEEALLNPQELEKVVGPQLATLWRGALDRQRLLTEKLRTQSDRKWVQVPRFSVTKLNLQELQNLGNLVLKELAL